MIYARLQADQLYTWSDTYAAQVAQIVFGCLAPTSPTAPASAPPAGSIAAWLADRALQALWQAGVQVCPQCWPRPQVLSLGELSQTAPADGLRAAGASAASPQGTRPLPPGARDPGGDLRDQPRTVAPPGGALRGRDEHGCFHAAGYAIRRRAPGQHAGRLAGEGVGFFDHCAGGRR